MQNLVSLSFHNRDGSSKLHAPPVSLRRELEVRVNAYLPDPERVSGQRLARRIDDVIAEGDLDLTRRRPKEG